MTEWTPVEGNLRGSLQPCHVSPAHAHSDHHQGNDHHGKIIIDEEFNNEKPFFPLEYDSLMHKTHFIS